MNLYFTSAPAVYGCRLQVHYPEGNHAQVPGRQGEVWTHLPLHPGGSWNPICVSWTWIGHQAINGLDEGVWNRTVGGLGAKG